MYNTLVRIGLTLSVLYLALIAVVIYFNGSVFDFADNKVLIADHSIHIYSKEDFVNIQEETE
jgi:hypothetical protein